jgi:plastocyanin
MTHTTSRRISRLAAAVLLTATMLAGCAEGADQTDEAQVAPVVIETFIFSPDPVTVPVGTTVVFENLDSTNHTVTAGTRNEPDTDLFDVDLSPGEATEWTFDEPGTYDYFCAFHSGPGMTGQVIVTAG